MKEKLLLVIILLLGAFFRFYNVNWDQGQHLHPDERFLTMVGNAMSIPPSIADYLNPQTSTMNPANINYKFFVYGTFPIVLNKVLAVVWNMDSYTSYTLQGRALSAFFDLLIILLVYKITHLLENAYHFDKRIKTFAAFFYAIAILPIQLSHFFAVDTFLSCFLLASLYFAMRFYYKSQWYSIIFCALFFGLGLATKISAIFFAPLIGYFLFIGIFFPLPKQKAAFTYIARLVLLVLIFILTSYITTRIADPYMFQDSNFLNPQLDATFVHNLKSQGAWNKDSVWFPPAVQWVSKPPVAFSLINLAVFGVGISYFIYILIGIFALIFFHSKTKHKDLILNSQFSILNFLHPLSIILLWTLVFFLYQSTQFVKAMRYFIFIYPFLAIYAAIGFSYFIKFFPPPIKIFLFVLLFIYPCMYMSIYVHKNSRIAASEWVYQHAPSGSYMLSEHWDDPLPLLLPQYAHIQYMGESMPVFAPDKDDKWQQINSALQKGDYYILSSNRAWGSIPTVPESFPKMVPFYRDLFAEKTNYQKVAEFTSYPQFSIFNFQFSIPDDWADESFTVYDHPKVIIFKNMAK